MSPHVPGHSGGHVSNPVPRIPETLAEIDIFKPDGIEAFIEPAYLCPSCPAHHQKGARRLVHLDSALWQFRKSICLIHSVAGPEPVQTEYFENKSPDCRERSKLKSALLIPIAVDQPSAGRSDTRLGKRISERRQTFLRPCVWIEDKNERDIEDSDALVGRSGEAPVLRVSNYLNAFGARQAHSFIARCIINHEHSIGRVAEAGSYTFRDHVRRIVSDDDDTAGIR